MSENFKGNNLLTSDTTGVVWDTKTSGKSFTVKTNGVTRLDITDSGIGIDVSLLPSPVGISGGGTGLTSADGSNPGKYFLGSNGSGLAYTFFNQLKGDFTPNMTWFKTDGSDTDGAPSFFFRHGVYSLTPISSSGGSAHEYLICFDLTMVVDNHNLVAAPAVDSRNVIVYGLPFPANSDSMQIMSVSNRTNPYTNETYGKSTGYGGEIRPSGSDYYVQRVATAKNPGTHIAFAGGVGLNYLPYTTYHCSGHYYATITD